MYSRPTKIGVLKLATPQIYTHLYEVAAWYTKIEVPAGEYDLIATFSNSSYGMPPITRAYWVMAQLPGFITEEYTPALWGGVPTGNSSGFKTEMIGKPWSYHAQTYSYVIAKAVVQKATIWGGTLDVPLGNGVTIDESPVDYGDGRKGTLYNFEVTL